MVLLLYHTDLTHASGKNKQISQQFVVCSVDRCIVILSKVGRTKVGKREEDMSAL